MAELDARVPCWPARGGSIKTGPFGTALKPARGSTSLTVAPGDLCRRGWARPTSAPLPALRVVAGRTVERLYRVACFAHGDVVFGAQGSSRQGSALGKGGGGWADLSASDGIRYVFKFGDQYGRFMCLFSFQIAFGPSTWLAGASLAGTHQLAASNQRYSGCRSSCRRTSTGTSRKGLPRCRRARRQDRSQRARRFASPTN